MHPPALEAIYRTLKLYQLFREKLIEGWAWSWKGYPAKPGQKKLIDLGNVLGRLRTVLERLEASTNGLGTSWGRPETSWGVFERSWNVLGPSRGFLGPS